MYSLKHYVTTRQRYLPSFVTLVVTLNVVVVPQANYWGSSPPLFSDVDFLIHPHPKVPSTRIRIFLKTHLFLSVLGSRPHGDGVFSHQKRSFSKTLSRVDLFENAVFLFSCSLRADYTREKRIVCVTPLTFV